jgi:dephospho-CoA kinase
MRFASTAGRMVWLMRGGGRLFAGWLDAGGGGVFDRIVMAGKPIIGLAGGIGSGKSTVASVLEDLGARIISSDRLNHEELNSPEVLRYLCSWWGQGVLLSDGRANREAIRRIIAADSAARTRLEKLVHPRIAARREALMKAYEADPAVRAIVWDSPLLFEAGLAGQCDRIIFVEAPRESRLARVMRDRAWTAEDLDRLEKSQKPLDFKRERADYIVVNNSDMEDLRRQVSDVFSHILSGN